MRSLFFTLLIVFVSMNCLHAQNQTTTPSSKKHGVVWSAGLFKSWLDDEYVGFNKIGNNITAIYSEQHKMGFAINSHYMFKVSKKIGLGIHLGLGLDVNSFIGAPVVLFGGSISLGSDHQFNINVGWADGKKRKIPGIVRDQIDRGGLTEIPVIYDNTELNTGFYLGIGYRIW